MFWEREWKGQEAKGGRELNLETCACVKGMCVCVCVRLVVKVRKMGVGRDKRGNTRQARQEAKRKDLEN